MVPTRSAPVSTKSFFQILSIPSRIQHDDLVRYNEEDPAKKRIVQLLYRHLLFFCSIVSGHTNWMPDDSPKDCRRCCRKWAS